MLVGREREQATIDALLEHARSGISGTLLVCGEPGIGKSALLRYAELTANGMTVLTASGIESESDLPFSGLAEFLEPVRDLIPEIPGPQAAALMGALALGPPSGSDPFAIFAATLSILAASAERQPVAVIIDDLQWLDASSERALRFASRRIHADRIAILLGSRTDVAGTPFLAGVERIVLRGIDIDACRRLLAGSDGSPAPRIVAESIHAGTGGNPLAILESRELLTAGQLSGKEPLADPLPTGPAIQRSFEQRVARLSRQDQLALLTLAASQSGSIAEVGRACSQLNSGLANLEHAEAVGLLISDGIRIRFRHPLMRAATYYGATPAARRAVHGALATSMGPTALPMERAYHLAAAAQGEDENVACSLEAAALDARNRSGHSGAWQAFERAARLTPDPEQRARRLHEAGSDAYIAGQAHRAAQLLDEALSLARDASLCATIEHSRGRVEMWTRSPAAARRILVAGADRIEAEDPERAALMLVDAVTTSMQEGDPGAGIDGMVHMTLRLSERAYALGSRAGSMAAAVAGGAYGKALVGVGRPRQGYPFLVASVDAIDPKGSLWLAVQIIQYATMFLYYEEFDRMRAPLESLIESARASSAPGALPYALGHLSELDFRTGHWAEAYANAAEAVELASELDHKLSLIYALACLAWIEAARGLDADCRAHLAQAAGVLDHAGRVVAVYTTRIVGLLELGLGRNEEAIKHLEPLAQALEHANVFVPTLFQEMPDLIEAYVHTSRLAEAQTMLAAFQRQAQGSPGTWVYAAAARCRGLLEEDYEPRFEEALELHARAVMPFERARTELCYGERLRRARRRAEARGQLHAALETFERLGAQPWANRARNELRATGETARRDRPASDELTLQELQVALRVAQGATNREAAAALFLSPKTVEAHLSRIYSKLRVRSRTELAHHFAKEGSQARQPTLAARR